MILIYFIAKQRQQILVYKHKKLYKPHNVKSKKITKFTIRCKYQQSTSVKGFMLAKKKPAKVTDLLPLSGRLAKGSFPT